LDLFGNVPFVTEANLPGATTPPERITRADLFAYVEKELLACATDLKAPKANEYGRADQAAAWALLAKLYLNADVYTQKPRYADCITYSSKVISAGYALKEKIVQVPDESTPDPNDTKPKNISYESFIPCR